jgi:apolipoprotein N-acyltransferase
LTDILTGIGAFLCGLAGWRRLAAAFLLGAFSAIAFAPLYFFPALLAGFAGLVLLLDGARASPHRLRAAAATGWAFAFGQFLIGMHWLFYPFLVHPDQNLFELPLGIPLLQAGLGLFGALAAFAASLFWRPGVTRLLALALSWALTEWLRGHVLTGFPWNLPGYGWGASLAIMQSAALIGSYGLSFLTILFAVSLSELARRSWRLPLAMTLLFAALWGYGALRLATPSADVPGVKLRLVQPDVPQAEMQGRFIARNWQRLLQLSLRPGNPTHIIWPEAAAAFPLARAPVALENIAALTARGAALMTGTVRLDDRDRIFNSLYMFAPGGRVLGVYDKSHLVPFGEYVPFASVLSKLGITKVTEGALGFSSGEGLKRYAMPGAPNVTPLICFEDSFPGAAVPPGQRPGWLVNVTDDSWFGPWAGPAQHLLTARMRSIEEGLPMVRVANTGISAAIDGWGRVLAQLPLGQSGVIDTALPRALPATPYARFGDLGFLLLLIAAATVASLIQRKGAK